MSHPSKHTKHVPKHLSKRFTTYLMSLGLCGLGLCGLSLVVSPAQAQQTEQPKQTQQSSDGTITVTDASGKPFTIKAANTKRVITLGGNITETIYALGAEKNIIATDTTSYFPAAVNKLPKVGYQRRLSAEGIISLKPTLVIGTTSAGPSSALEHLRSVGIPVLILPHKYSPASTKSNITALGKVFGSDKANSLNRQLDQDLAKVNTFLEGTKKTSPPKVMFIYARSPQGANVGGHDTAADAIIRLAGGINAFSEVKGYKPLTPEVAVSTAPDIILMLSRGLKSVGGIEGALKLPGIAQTPAAKNRAVVALDDLYLLGFGPRLGQAVLDLAKEIHR